MEDAFKDGYFPPDLALGMQTGWGYKEIRDMDPYLKLIYIKFLELKEEKEAKEIEEKMAELDGKGKPFTKDQPKNLQFVKEEDFVSKV